jgi:hypothetical protein
MSSERSVTYVSGPDTAKCWSEWQDLNLRPPRPERGALPDRATLPLYLRRTLATAAKELAPATSALPPHPMHYPET